MGTQQQKSVKTITDILLAIESLPFDFSDLIAAFWVFRATLNMTPYDTIIVMKDTKFNPRNIKTEYSQPLGLSGVMCRAKHTPDRP